MKFFVDAQLPPVLKSWLIQQGHDCTHALDLPKKDSTPDIEIVEIVTIEERILISKDGDFFKLKLLTGTPQRILIITTGNIRNPELIASFERNFESALRLFRTFEIVELGNHFVTGRNIES
ncbi:hypothetical protein BH10ACI2_BH10ACI2_14890 [soil metagenome]